MAKSYYMIFKDKNLKHLKHPHDKRYIKVSNPYFRILANNLKWEIAKKFDFVYVRSQNKKPKNIDPMVKFWEKEQKNFILNLLKPMV